MDRYEPIPGCGLLEESALDGAGEWGQDLSHAGMSHHLASQVGAPGLMQQPSRARATRVCDPERPGDIVAFRVAQQSADQSEAVSVELHFQSLSPQMPELPPESIRDSPACALRQAGQQATRPLVSVLKQTTSTIVFPVPHPGGGKPGATRYDRDEECVVREDGHRWVT